MVSEISPLICNQWSQKKKKKIPQNNPAKENNAERKTAKVTDKYLPVEMMQGALLTIQCKCRSLRYANK